MKLFFILDLSESSYVALAYAKRRKA